MSRVCPSVIRRNPQNGWVGTISFGAIRRSDDHFRLGADRRVCPSARATVEDYLSRCGIDKAYCMKMVVDFLEAKGQAKRSEIIRLLSEKLSAALTMGQKQDFIRNRFQEMRKS